MPTMRGMTPPPPEPTPAEMRAYQTGTLPLERFDVVDAWLAGLTAQEQARLLDGDRDAATDAHQQLLVATEPGTPKAWFLGERLRSRYRHVDRIGAGGMGVVDAVHDQVLDRDLALKRCRPREPQEGVDDYALRLRSFRREAAITAQLEHPAIVPVHDIGVGPYGEPAFLMKRLEGQPLTSTIARRRLGAHVDLADLIQIMVRISEAVGHAHSRSIVHRDLKPDNLIVGDMGAVYVIDWGLATVAGRTGPASTALGSPSGLTGFGVGTRAWMAPEQAAGAAADPRMDVFALGGILMAVLTGAEPRCDVAGAHGPLPRVDLGPLSAARIPPGLAAVARRCLADAPGDRYADGGAVAAELRRWLSAGVTSAEHPPLARVLLLRLRRSPRLITALVVAVVGLAAAGAWEFRHRLAHHDDVLTRLGHVMARVAIDDAGSVRVALHEVHDLAGLGTAADEIRAAEVRLSAAGEALDLRAAQEVERQRLQSFAATYRIRGPWPAEVADLDAALTDLGLALTPERWAADAELIRRHALRDQILATLVQLQRALIVTAREHPARRTIPSVIAAATADAAWHALARLLERCELAAHDLRLPAGLDAEQALQSPVTADILLATYGPEARLVRYASSRLATDPGAFWPRVIAARAALQDGRPAEAERHALVALGAEPMSLWPHLVLGYVALAGQDAARVVAEADAGLAANPDNLELAILRAAGLARGGQVAAAQAAVDAAHAAAHLQYHLQHPVGHPMERSVQALVDSGVRIPAAEPLLGPVVHPAH